MHVTLTDLDIDDVLGNRKNAITIFAMGTMMSDGKIVVWLSTEWMIGRNLLRLSTKHYTIAVGELKATLQAFFLCPDDLLRNKSLVVPADLAELLIEKVEVWDALYI